MLFKTLDKLKRNTIMAAIILIMIGMVFLILPDTYIPYISSGISFILLVAAATSVFDFIGSSKALIHYITLAAGLLVGILGIALFIFEDMLVGMLSWMIGVAPIVLGMIGILQAVVFARRSNRGGWWILIILFSLLIVFGAFVFASPWKDAQTMMRVIGGTLMYSAFISLIGLIWIWPIHRISGGGDEEN
ncbi:MAG: DUF308 domain-containing protein [Clostridia bacterium]|nr:DUF308 domain-containing protein [Clostridia bacterium]